MKNVPILFHPSEGEVRINRIYGCEYCRDQRQVEVIGFDGFPTGYFKPCMECLDVDVDSQGVKD